MECGVHNIRNQVALFRIRVIQRIVVKLLHLDKSILLINVKLNIAYHSLYVFASIWVVNV